MNQFKSSYMGKTWRFTFIMQTMLLNIWWQRDDGGALGDAPSTTMLLALLLGVLEWSVISTPHRILLFKLKMLHKILTKEWTWDTTWWGLPCRWRVSQVIFLKSRDSHVAIVGNKWQPWRSWWSTWMTSIGRERGWFFLGGLGNQARTRSQSSSSS